MPHDVSKPAHVGLFVTCLVDLFRPSIGFAAVELLERAGYTVEVPMAQTCCGQPSYNSGDSADTVAIARKTIETFEDYDYIVAPSGSCAGMLRLHYPALFKDDKWKARAVAFSNKVYELTSFLTDIAHVDDVKVSFDSTVTYHDSCAGLRELSIYSQPRKLIASVKGLVVTEMADADVCCGFGGTFCVKYPEISNRIVEEKTRQIQASGAGTLLAGDLGCLMNMAGKLQRQGSDIEVRHVAEVLAGMADIPAIGKPKAEKGKS